VRRVGLLGARKVAAILVPPLAALVTACSAAPVSSTSTQPAAHPLTVAQARQCAVSKPATWMGCLVAADPSFGRRQLTAIAIPGSHDSGTFDLDESTFDEASSSDCTSYNPVFASVPALVDRWSTTQDLDYPAQLDAGIRYLDVRVAYSGSAARGWRIVHTLFSTDPLAADMASIAAWARAHPSEVVIVDFQHVCYDNDPDAAADDQLWSELAPLSPVAYDPAAGSPVGVATIDDVIHQGGGAHNVVVLVPAGVLRPSDLLGRYGVHATFTVAPGSPGSPRPPSPTVVEEYAWPSSVGPVSVAGESAAEAQLAAYPASITPELGTLEGRGFYQSQLIYSVSGANEVQVLSSFGGLITPSGAAKAHPAWEAGLWQAAPARNAIVAGWGRRLNVVVTDEAEHGGFVVAVVEQNAA
jgi:hypothetical protein